jgi:hypothetical protein
MPADWVTDSKDLNIGQLRGSEVKAAVRTVWHRLKQARSAFMKFEATWAGIQFLFALGPIGVVIGTILWLRGRHKRGEAAQTATAAPLETNGAAHPPTPAAGRTPANAAANGLVN